MTIFGRIRVRTIRSDRDPTKKVRIRPDPYTQQCKTPLHTYILCSEWLYWSDAWVEIPLCRVKGFTLTLSDAFHIRMRVAAIAG